MKQIYEDLWQSEKGSHFGMSMKTYLLQTTVGNVLIYYSDAPDEIAQLKEIGNIQYQYISHNHELTPAMFQNLEDFGATLCMHQKALNYLKKEVKPPITFSENTLHLPNLEVLNTPGHTNNNISLYYKSPHGKNYLFTGDTIYLDHGKWNTFVMPQDGGSYSDLKESLLVYKQLKVDVIMPSVGIGANKAVEVTQKEWLQIINELLIQL